MILALTSDKLPPQQLYDAASTILLQRISQIRGVGQVLAGGSSAPAVRVDLNPTQLNHYGVSLDAVKNVFSCRRPIRLRVLSQTRAQLDDYGE